MDAVVYADGHMHDLATTAAHPIWLRRLSAALAGGLLLLVSALGSAQPAPAQPPGAEDAAGDGAQTAPDACLPVVAAECGCVYGCAPGWSGAGGTWEIRHGFWDGQPLNATVQQWCVDGSCTDAFFAEIVCDGICAPRPADATCGLMAMDDGTTYCGSGVSTGDWDPATQGFDYEDQAGACGVREPLTEFACRYDSDCVVCHDGSACGVVVNRAELAVRGAACQLEDSAECESSRPRCCEGHCARASY